MWSSKTAHPWWACLHVSSITKISDSYDCLNNKEVGFVISAWVYMVSSNIIFHVILLQVTLYLVAIKAMQVVSRYATWEISLAPMAYFCSAKQRSSQDRYEYTRYSAQFHQKNGTTIYQNCAANPSLQTVSLPRDTCAGRTTRKNEQRG